MRVSEKNIENFERLGRQARPRIEPDTSRLPVYESCTTLPLVGPRTNSLTSMPYPGFEPGTLGTAAGFPSHFTAFSAKIKVNLKLINALITLIAKALL